MRGEDLHQDNLYSYISPEQRVPANRPLRAIRQMVNRVLERLSPEWDTLYSAVGRPSTAPEKLLQVLYTLRSERLLIEELDHNLLFRWFVGLTMDGSGLECHIVLQESPTPAERRGGQAFFQRC
jgi:transposase